MTTISYLAIKNRDVHFARGGTMNGLDSEKVIEINKIHPKEYTDLTRDTLNKSGKGARLRAGMKGFLVKVG